MDPSRIPGLPEADLRQMKAAYYGLASEVDHQIGRLVDHLKESGAYEKTLIVFTSDHGDLLGDHWQFSKYSYFDQAFHVPLIVRDPRAAAASGRGRKVAAFSENVDVMPTILEALGLEVPRQCDGLSLAPFLAGESPADWRAEAHWEYDFRDLIHRVPERALGLDSDQCLMNVIRGERYKYVHFTALPPVFFDLQEDPGETRNLAGDPAYAPLVLDHAQRLLSWRMAHDERGLTDCLLTPEGLFRQGR
jgi:arylsulfatase A-like enzyme